MKNFYLIPLFLFYFGLCFSQAQDSLSIEEQQRREKNIQAGNPFEKFGYKPKISTLSKGKYLEFHDQDSIVQIGSFTFHVKKKIITGYILKETKYSEATLRPEIVSRWFSPDPLADEFSDWSPYNFTMNNPIRFIDPDGLAPLDIILKGANNSSITVVTDLIDVSIDASSLIGDLGGNYSFQGDDILVAALDIVGIFDPSPISDGLAASIEGKNGNWGGAILSGLGTLSYIGDIAKVGKIPKHLNTIENAIDGVKQTKVTKQERMQEIATDSKQSSYVRGWFKNEKRHIEFGNKKTMRNPGNGRNSPGRKAEDKGLELAHPSNSPASKGGDFKGAKYKNHGEHKVETRIHRRKYQ